MEAETEMLKNFPLKSISRSKHVSTASMKIDLIEDPDWTGCEFITRKKGRFPPKKEECMKYYDQRIKSYFIDMLITITANHGRFSWTERYMPLLEVHKEGFQTLTVPCSAVYRIELIAPGNYFRFENPGVRINGKFELKIGQKITVALGQQGLKSSDGCGGSFLVLESDEGLKPLLIAGGAGSSDNREFGRGSISQTAVRNGKLGSSGIQDFRYGDKYICKYPIYCAGAGFSEEPQVFNLYFWCSPPQTYKDGLIGGAGICYSGEEVEGGFGGGGASFEWKGWDRALRRYYGAGGGFTGGSTQISEKPGDGNCWGGGGGSFSADPKATFDHKFVEYGYCKIEKIE